MKPERDPVTCAVCDREATFSTPEGGMCEEHARELARKMGPGGEEISEGSR